MKRILRLFRKTDHSIHARKEMQELGLPRKSKAEIPVTQQPSSQIIENAAPKTNSIFSEFIQRDFRFIAVDVETANSNNFSICQIGLAGATDDGQVTTLGTLVNPEEEIDPAFENIHGISNDMVSSAPTFIEIYDELSKILEGKSLIQHSNFDKRALDMACHIYELPKINADWADSVQIARKAWPEFKEDGGHGLANLKTKLDLKFKHHDAEEDARAAAQVVLLAEKHTGNTYRKILATRQKPRFQPTVNAEGNPNGPLYGHVACFTGKISLARTDAAAITAEAGITVKPSVTQKTTLLIVGDQDMTLLAGHTKSGKHRKAEKLIADGNDIRILSETEFLVLLGKA